MFFCIGACVGSFLNVCILRIPAGRSIVNPPSHCACGRPIKWHDNIPVLGWLFLRGKARCCGRKISIRYPAVELLTALIFTGMWFLFPAPVAIVGMVFAALMIFCTFVDLDTMMLPDFATVGGTILGFIISVAVPQLHGAEIPDAPWLASAVKSAICSALGIIIGSGVVYWIRLLGEHVFKREAMGEGDIILLGCIGAFCGWQGALFAIFAGSMLGAVVMIPIVLATGMFSKKKEAKKKSYGGEEEEFDATAIPFGPWLALGGLLYFMLFSGMTDAYFASVAKMLF